MQFSIGGIEVAVIVDDDDFELPSDSFLPTLDRAALEPDRHWLEPEFLRVDRDVLRCAIQSFVLRLDGRTVLVDSCIGEHKDRPQIPAWHRRSGTGWLDRLRACGVTPEGVDLVFCTHLHIDHVGWNTVGSDGKWTPTFPNARYLVGDRELADWQARMSDGTVEAIQLPGLIDSVLPLLDAGRVDLVRDGMEIAAGAAVLPLPGHTSGQVGLRLDRPDGRALFCGDAIHNPVQILQPAASTASCRNPAQAARTRAALLDEAAASGRLIVPAHFRGSRRVTVERRGDGFRPLFPA
jgi:glyoxylase-like metal-dependent hydrolase (beta-lactamase superfamily II)